MQKFKNYLLPFIFLICISCSKDNIKESFIKEKNLNQQVIEAYKEGKKSLEEGDALFAAKKFNEAEILFPQSEMAPQSALMAAYSIIVKIIMAMQLVSYLDLLKFIQKIKI